MARDIFPKEPAEQEINQMVEASSDRISASRPWEDRSLSPGVRYDTYKAVARAHVEDVIQAMQREGLTEGDRTAIRLNPDTQFWKKELEQLLKETPDEFCRRIAIPSLLSRYEVRVINDHTVSFVLPQGCSRIEILSWAQELEQERYGGDLIHPSSLRRWQKDSRFTTAVKSTERICIDGHVAGGDQKDKATQEKLLSEKGLVLPRMEDLAVAFALYRIATCMLLWGGERFLSGEFHVARAATGALEFTEYGLIESAIRDHRDDYRVAVSGLVSREA
jgi:hypothetical protein